MSENDKFILFLTAHSMKSKWRLREFGSGNSSNTGKYSITIFPFLRIKDTHGLKLNPFIQQ